MTGSSAGRDAHEVEALVTDRYLETLLVAHARGADRGPIPLDPDSAVRRAADRLARDLPRFHPSFRFEEALSGRLHAHAMRMAMPGTTGAERIVFPLPGGHPFDDANHERTDEVAGGSGRRPLLIGGALTSAALSLAGAAYVAWRLNRPSAGPMVRAARAVARTRPV